MKVFIAHKEIQFITGFKYRYFRYKLILQKKKNYSSDDVRQWIIQSFQHKSANQSFRWERSSVLSLLLAGCVTKYLENKVILLWEDFEWRQRNSIMHIYSYCSYIRDYHLLCKPWRITKRSSDIIHERLLCLCSATMFSVHLFEQ